MKTRILTTLLSLFLFFACKNAEAQITYVWQGGSSGNWSTPGNWNVLGFTQVLLYPGSTLNNDIAQINSNASITLPSTLPGGSIFQINVANGATVTLTLPSGLSFKVTGSINVGTSSTATLNFNGPGSVTGSSAININTNSTLTSNTTCSITAASLTMASGTTATFNDGATLSGAITVNGTATIGGGSTVSAASMALTSSSSLTENGNITLSGGGTVSNGTTPTVIVGSGYTLKVGGGLTVGNYSASGITFAGSGSESVSGSSAFDQYANLVVNSGNTLNFNASSNTTFNNYCTITNGGTITGTSATLTCSGNNNYFTNSGTLTLTGGALTFNTGSTGGYINNTGTFKVASSCTVTLGNNNEYLTNTGTVSAASSTFNMSGSGAYISNSATFHATACTFTFGNDNFIQNSYGATFITQPSCIFNMTTTGSYIANIGTWTDHGSTYTMTGQGAAINNGSIMTFRGATVNFASGGGNGQNILNIGTLQADSATSITCGNYATYINNTGTFYAGTSNSSCIITLSAQSSYLTSSGTFYLGSTSIIYPSAYGASISNTGSGVFTLQSDAYGSAAIGSLGTNCAVNGTYNVQRYFQGSTTYNSTTKRWIGRNYRIISSPVYNVAYSGNNTFGLNYIVGSTAGETTTANSSTNAFITGCSGGSTTAGNPSVYVYDEGNTPSNTQFTSGNFLGVTNITNSTSAGTINVTGTGFSSSSTYSLPVGTGIFFFFRGAAYNFTSRTTAPYTAPENVTLTSTGYINTYGITYKDWYTPSSSNLGYTGTGTAGNHAARGFNMVGNPYPCTIDWCQAYSGSGGIVRTNVNPTIYTFDPVNNQYDAFLATSASGGTATGNGSRYIMSGQGFVVQANATGAALTINEAAKAATQQSTGSALLMGTPTPELAGTQVMRLKVSIDSTDFDDLALLFNSSASANYNPNEDAAYIRAGAAAEGLSSFSADSARLSINSLPLPGKTPLVIRLSLDATFTGTYTMEKMQLDAIPKLYRVWLMDKQKKDSLDMRANSTYIFDVNTADTTSYGNNRFELVIRQDPALMVHLLNFTAVKATGGSQITWTTENEVNYTDFTLQRSTDGGTTWTTLEGLVSSGQGTYAYLDANPALGADSYRLQITDLNNDISYSNIITLTYSSTTSNAVASNISVYPNPASSTVNLAINQTNTNTISTAGQSALQTAAVNPGLSMASASTSSASYSIKIISITGSVVRTGSTTGQTWQQSVADLNPGTYVIKVLNNKDNSVVGSSTFIKL